MKHKTINFRYEDEWALEEECGRLIEEVHIEIENEDDSLSKVQNGLKRAGF